MRPIAPSGLGGTFGFGSPLGFPRQPATTQVQSGSMRMGGMGGGMGGSMGEFGGGGMGGFDVPAPALPRAMPLQPANPESPPDSGGQFCAKAFRHYRAPQIALQPYDPTATYVKELKAVADRRLFAVYLHNRPRYARSPDFFLDCADFFFGRQENDRALQVLSNLAELDSRDPSLRRRLAERLARAGEFDLAIITLEEAIKLWPNEPQVYRDLALVLVQRADAARTATKGRKMSRLPPKGHDEAPTVGQGKVNSSGTCHACTKAILEKLQ